jgi:HPt (histidine-containing phosphotransfer) domain-containing protein
MSGPPGDGKSAPIDRSKLAEISGGDQSIECRLLTVFRRANDADVAALKEALEKRDMVSVTRASHRVKGAGKIVGAMAIADICERIEHAGRAGDWDTIAASSDALCLELDRINAYLGTLYRTSAP